MVEELKAFVINQRIKRLKKMDNYVKNVIRDEKETHYWLAIGVPDNASEEDYQFIAKEDEEYNRCCRAFCAIVVDR